MDMYDAIFVRKSTRKFKDEPLAESAAEAVRKLVDGAERLYPGIDMRVEIVMDGKKVQDMRKGIVGSFGKIIAPHYLVITSEEKPGYRENIGYALEQVVLGMTAMGIATCWIGGNVDWEAMKKRLDIGDGQEPVIMIAFGKPLHDEDMLRKEPGDAKRKVLEQIVAGTPDATWAKALEATRLAPSAGNSQPWRFFMEDGRADLFIARGNVIQQRLFGSINYVDAGIALCHMAIAARKFGVDMKIRKLPEQTRDGHNYISSLIRA